MEDRRIIEDILSKSSLRVIRALALNPLATKYTISKITSLKHRDVTRALAKLHEYNIIVEVKGAYNRYKLNYENKIVNRLLKFLEDIGYI